MKKITEYIRNQPQEDLLGNKLSLKEYIGVLKSFMAFVVFMREPISKGKRSKGCNPPYRYIVNHTING